MATYLVTAPYVTVNVGTHDGRKLIGYYNGATLPSDAGEEGIKHLLRMGMIVDLDAATAPDQPGEAVDDVDGDGPIPAKSAPKDAWVSFAVSQGAAQGDAEASTKDDLIAAYGTA